MILLRSVLCSMEAEGSCLPAALSPRVSATEMYRSAVANVRKSAKRVAVPPLRNTSRGESVKGPALLPRDCDDNVLATGDWLIDDYSKSPTKKRQRDSRSSAQVDR